MAASLPEPIPHVSVEIRDVAERRLVTCIEVLSPTTEAFDRGEKWARYQTWLPELADYLLVSQTTAHIDHYRRRAGGGWIYKLVQALEAQLRLDSIGCDLHLADVYDRVQFPPEPLEDEGADEALEA